MKNTIQISLFLLVGIISLSSCGAAKMAKYMDGHQAMLQEAIAGNLSSEQKLDVVANSFVAALEESLSYSSTKQSVKHINQYSKANEKQLNVLLKGLDGWVAGMSTADKMMMLGKLASKPYAGKLMDLVPKFERKVNRKITTFKIASKIIGLVKPKLF